MKQLRMMVIFLGLFVFAIASKAMADNAKTDGEIIGLVSAIDKNEIDAAKVAEGKNIDAGVVDYAKMLDKEHSENLQKLNDLAEKEGIKPPATTGAVLLGKGIKDRAMLSPRDGKDFSDAYLAAMVKGHTEALDLIDTQLMPSVQNAALKSLLTETRQHVAMHLDKAKGLQKF